MGQERKKKKVLIVKRAFEPDRMSPANMEAAYEKVVPRYQYRMVALERKSEPLDRTVREEEVAV